MYSGLPVQQCWWVDYPGEIDQTSTVVWFAYMKPKTIAGTHRRHWATWHHTSQLWSWVENCEHHVREPDMSGVTAIRLQTTVTFTIWMLTQSYTDMIFRILIFSSPHYLIYCIQICICRCQLAHCQLTRMHLSKGGYFISLSGGTVNIKMS